MHLCRTRGRAGVRAGARRSGRDTTAVTQSLNDISFDMLRLLDRVAALRNLTSAARELGMAPSTATRKLAALEANLSVRLFQRTTRNMKLSEAGAVALAWARETLGAAEVTADDLASIVGAPTGRIRLAANHYAVSTYLPALLAKFGRAHPAVSISLTATDALVDLVEERYDAALHAGRIPDSRMVGIQIASFKRRLCASPEYLGAHGQPADVADLIHHRCLVHGSNERGNWFFRKGDALVGQQVPATVETDNYLVLNRMTLLGAGIGRLSEDVMAPEFAAGKLVHVLPEYECVSSNGELPGLWLLYQDRKVLHRVRLLVDFLRREIPRARLQ